jgi:hypothetical protein
LLRLSPTLTDVVSHDPSLLANQEYVQRNNPQLAQFLAAHPEIVRNPEFYLFTHMKQEDGATDPALEHPGSSGYTVVYHASELDKFMDKATPAVVFICFFAALIWLVRFITENRRWSRVFKLQSEVHGKLIDKFASSQELAQYMETEAGKRFLEAAPISVGFEPEKPIPNAIARILTPLQIGVVLVLIGFGLFGIHCACTGRDFFVPWEFPIMVLNYLTMMTGLGFIISAGISWYLAKRLGLIPEGGKASGEHDARPASSAPSGTIFDPRERQ